MSLSVSTEAGSLDAAYSPRCRHADQGAAQKSDHTRLPLLSILSSPDGTPCRTLLARARRLDFQSSRNSRSAGISGRSAPADTPPPFRSGYAWAAPDRPRAFVAGGPCTRAHSVRLRNAQDPTLRARFADV